MKRRYKKLLSMLGACVLSVPFAGCETDAEEVDGAQTNSTTTTSASATSTNASTVTTVSPIGGEAPVTNDVTEVASGEAGGTNTVSEQIVQRIPPQIPANVTLSPGVQEVVKLLQSGVSETVVLLFVEKSTESFELDAADIVYLNDIGVSATVLAAMLNHDGAEPDVLHNALGTNALAGASAASAPTTVPIVTNVLTQPAPQVEVSSNFVAGPQYGYGAAQVQGDPNAEMQAQQPVVVEQQPQVVVTQPQVTYSYFYDSLSPYGSWVYVTDYGWCWQPTIAVTHRAWRPYMHGGRWLYSDVGWYWHSDYSWGWAPFHYGRWHCSPRIGWVWTPDYTWGPSWVTWRRTGDYCGWAPLPPRCYVRPGIGFSYWGRDVGFSFSFGYSHDYYTFVPTRRFCDRRVIDHVVPTERTRNIYRDSTVVNNYIVGNNNTIINNGVGRDYVASRTQNEIPRVRVQDSTGGARVAPDRLVRNGAETVVFRPQRPPERLRQAHEEAVARTRTETARVSGSSGGVSTRASMIASRSTAAGRPEALTPNNSGVVRPTSPRASTSPTRTETARPQLASRGNTEVPIPSRGIPAPVRPEPDRSAEILKTRIAQESRVRPGTGPTVDGSVTVGGATGTPGARPGVVRPSAPARTEVPRNEISTGVVPQPSTRPGAPAVSTRPTSPAPTQRGNEVVRPRTDTTRPTVETPSGRTVPTTPPAASPNFSRPSITARPQPAQSSGAAATPQVVRPAQPSPAPAQSPAFSRPALNNNAAPNVSQPNTSGGFRQSTIQPAQPRVSAPAPAQPVQRPTVQSQAPAPAVRPSITPRNESFSRPAPSVPVQRSAPVQSVQPRSVPPSAPVQRPVIRPQASTPAPPARLAPSRGAQTAAPVSRSSSSSAPAGSGRGRVEIGR